MIGFIPLFSVGALLFTILLAVLIILVVRGGIRRRSGLGEQLPRWQGCPAAWCGKSILCDETHISWPSGHNWETIIRKNAPDNNPDRPYAIRTENEVELLYLPGRFRGTAGWWVVLLEYK